MFRWRWPVGSRVRLVYAQRAVARCPSLYPLAGVVGIVIHAPQGRVKNHVVQVPGWGLVCVPAGHLRGVQEV